MLLVLPFAGCVDTLQDVALPPGNMSASGRINPCHGWESDKQLCGDDEGSNTLDSSVRREMDRPHSEKGKRSDP
jgi:hypothetical protein